MGEFCLVAQHVNTELPHNQDSADIYADNEDLLGAWFKRTGRRDEVFLATKFGNVVDKEGNRTVRGDPE